MSDNKRVESDTSRCGGVMSTAIIEASQYLNELTRYYHRGRGDTLGAARDRAAKAAGISRTYAKRIWDRCHDMRDVSGEAYRNLRAAYEALCEQNEDAAKAYRAERLALREIADAVDQERHLASRGTLAARASEAEE